MTESPIPTPITLKPRQAKPFLIEYRDNRTDRFFEKATDDVQATLAKPTIEGKSLTEVAREVYSASLRHADKYLFTPSALAMHRAVFHLPSRPINNHTWVDVESNVWIELQEPLEDKQGKIKALYLTQAYPKREIEQVVPASRFPFTNQTLHKIFRVQVKEWTLAVIREDTRVVYNFTYDAGIEAWVFSPTSHKCPYNQCARVPVNMADASYTLLPCEQCKQDNWYWTQWLHTALLIVQRHYVTDPTQADEAFPTETQEYQSEEKITVGKGKNKRHIKQQIKRNVDFYLVKFDVSVKQPVAAPKTREEREAEKHPNWLVTTERGDIIYIRKQIAEYTRHYPTGTAKQHEPTEVVTVKSHPKYVPMLNPQKRKAEKITKVVASQYENEAK